MVNNKFDSKQTGISSTDQSHYPPLEYPPEVPSVPNISLLSNPNHVEQHLQHHQPIVVHLQTSDHERVYREYEKRRIQKENNQFSVTLLFVLGFLFPPLWIVSCVYAFKPRRNNAATRSIGISAFVMFILLTLLLITAIIVAIAVPVAFARAQMDDD